MDLLFFNILFMFISFVLYSFFYIAYFVFLCCFVYRFFFCAVSCLFLHRFTDHCHRVETQLQSINIIIIIDIYETSFLNTTTQLHAPKILQEVSATYNNTSDLPYFPPNKTVLFSMNKPQECTLHMKTANYRVFLITCSVLRGGKRGNQPKKPDYVTKNISYMIL